MEEAERKIYATLAYVQKLDDGHGISPEILQLNLKQVDVVLSKEDLNRYVESGILLNNESGVSVSQGASEYLTPEHLERAWLEFPEIRQPFRQMRNRCQKKNILREILNCST